MARGVSKHQTNGATVSRRNVADQRRPSRLTPRFELGSVSMTPGAANAMEEHGIDPNSLLRRHVSGDWGGMPAEDKVANEQALHSGARIFSGYIVAPGVKVWVITDAATAACLCYALSGKPSAGCAICGGTGRTDIERRHTTTILLPSEY